MQFMTEVKVTRIGSDSVKSASGTTSIVWNFVFLATSKGIQEIRVTVPPQNLILNLEAWNDDTNQDDKWSEEFTTIKVKIDGRKAEYRSEDIVKALSEGLMPKELEIWNSAATLSF